MFQNLLPIFLFFLQCLEGAYSVSTAETLYKLIRDRTLQNRINSHLLHSRHDHGVIASQVEQQNNYLMHLEQDIATHLQISHSEPLHRFSLRELFNLSLVSKIRLFQSSFKPHCLRFSFKEVSMINLSLKTGQYSTSVSSERASE